MSNYLHFNGRDEITYAVVYIVGVLAQFLWEAQAHKVSGR